VRDILIWDVDFCKAIMCFTSFCRCKISVLFKSDSSRFTLPSGLSFVTSVIYCKKIFSFFQKILWSGSRDNPTYIYFIGYYDSLDVECCSLTCENNHGKTRYAGIHAFHRLLIFYLQNPRRVGYNF